MDTKIIKQLNGEQLPNANDGLDALYVKNNEAAEYVRTLSDATRSALSLALNNVGLTFAALRIVDADQMPSLKKATDILNGNPKHEDVRKAQTMLDALLS